MRARNHRSAFTLIEVMVVVIIIAALASMVVVNLMGVPDSARKRIARGSMAEIDVALKLYRLETGSYPKELSALRAVPSGVEGRTEPYLSGEPLDPWEQQFRYKCPGSHNTTGYDLYSIGPNKVDDNGGTDDIANWKKE